MRPGRVLAGLLTLCCAGCARVGDPRQAEACRIAAVALYDPALLAVVAQAFDAPSSEGRTTVAITLRSEADAGIHRVTCTFAAARGADKGDLVDVRTDGERLSPARLFMLERFWLGSPDAAAADPLRTRRGTGLPRVPFGIAYALQILLASLPAAGTYALLAAAYSLVYGLAGRINLAFGEIAALGSVAALLGAALTDAASPVLILVVAGLFGVWCAGIHGAMIERLVSWPLRRSTGQQGLVATIGLALALQEYTRLVSGTQGRYLPPLLSQPIDLLRAESFIVTATPLSLIVFGVAGLAGAGLLSALRFTRFGREWRAASDDPLAASLFGVDPRRLSLNTFLVACGLAGLAGASSTLQAGSVGMVYTTTLGLKALIAAIVGGIGSVPGAFLGGLAIATTEALWSAYFPIVYRDLVVDCLLVAVLVWRPGGLFGYRDLLPRRV